MPEQSAVRAFGCELGKLFYNGIKRTYQQRGGYMLEAVKKRRAKVWEMAVEYKGSSCEVCGYNRCIEALEFHQFDEIVSSF